MQRTGNVNDQPRESLLISGVSSGIGLSTAKEGLKRGYRVCGISRTEPHCDGIDWLPTDIRNPNEVSHAVEALLSDDHRLAGVLCGAGVGLIGAVEDTNADQVAEIFATNYFGTANLIRAALPKLRSNGGGQVVILGSLAGQVPLPFQAHYSASKAAVENMALALSTEVKSFGISVVLLALGDVQTNFLRRCTTVDRDGSPYGTSLRGCISVIEADMAAAPMPDAAVELVMNALTVPSHAPKRSFGPHSIATQLGKRLLPVRIARYLVARHFGLDGGGGQVP